MENAKKHLPNEQFRQETKFGLILYNEIYDPTYVTHGNLPEVVNDCRNARQTCKMLGIPSDNTIELKDASHDQLTYVWNNLRDKIQALAKPMNGKTGILGSNPSLFANGFEWDNIKEFVMEQKEPFDHIDIDLDPEDQKNIE